ncbi:MAG: sigma-70 family RNA polymerase sigma factor [Lewinellaceae bacterium]|nr:sigma-70 family RNA polymerase sigma factor [Lewinellaceae bacterium]
MNETQLLQIIEGCRQGHSPSEEALFRHFAPMVLATARRYAADEPQALDFLQECFVVVFDKIKKFDPQKGAFQGWMYRVSVNVMLQILRKNKRMQQHLELPVDLPDAEIKASELEILETPQILKALRELPEGYREVFNLYVFEDWSHRDIAQALGISESSSRSQLTRAKKLLKQKLQQVIRQYEQGLV